MLCWVGEVHLPKSQGRKKPCCGRDPAVCGASECSYYKSDIIWNQDMPGAKKIYPPRPLIIPARRLPPA
jgi:hypothetical protein